MGIIKLTGVGIMASKEVTETIAYLEGDCDRTPEYWRELDGEFFRNECV
nr:ASCH domain-containing protein [Listeria monocytogenes]